MSEAPSPLSAVSDTCSVIFWLADRSRLGKRARELFEKAHLGEATVYIPTLVIPEIILKVEKKQLEIDIHQFCRTVEQATGFHFVSFDFNIALIFSDSVLRKIRDPFDRLIAAHVRHMKLPLMTCDRVLREHVDVLW